MALPGFVETAAAPQRQTLGVVGEGEHGQVLLFLGRGEGLGVPPVGLIKAALH